jgi:hypothetical protein
MGNSQLLNLSGTVEAIYRAESAEALKRAMESGLLAFGLDSFVMSVNAKDKQELVLAPSFTTWPDYIAREYDELGFVEYDPVLAHFMKTRQPMVGAASGDQLFPDTVKGRRYLDYLNNTPLAAGAIIPLPSAAGRVSGIAASSSTGLVPCSDFVVSVSLIANVAMMKAEALGLCTSADQARVLDADPSPRQFEILHWAAQGNRTAPSP